VRKLIIAIDGPVGSGKSSVGRRVAELLDYTYLDSGAMYRALAWKALCKRAPLDSPESLEALARETRIDLEVTGGPPCLAGANTGGSLRVRLDGTDVTDAIRGAEVSQASSKIAVVPGVRAVLVSEQRRAGRSGGVVMEGRDIGTVVFPDADLKIFLDASVEVRAERRWREHQQKGESIELARMVEEVRERDRRDRDRETSPLVRAPDAVLVDNTAMDVEETARLIVLLARERVKAWVVQGKAKRR
jgi:cytidylate kinase